MKKIGNAMLLTLVSGMIFGLSSECARADFSKTITVSPGAEVNAVTTWYFSSCTMIIATGSYTINVAPKHGAISVGGISAPIPGCPAGSPALPAAVAYYTWTDTTSDATSDSFQLYYNVNGQVGEVDDISVVLSSGGGGGGGGSTNSCAAAINGGIAAPTLSGDAYGLLGSPINILGAFTPASGMTLAQAAQLCGFQKFDWKQTIIQLPDPSPFCEINPTDLSQPLPNPFCAVNDVPPPGPPYPIHVTSLSTPINDPPPNGWTYGFYNSYPFYYPQATLESTCAQYTPGLTGSTCTTPVVSADGLTLSFFDDPGDACIAGPLGVPSIGYEADPRMCGFSTTGDGAGAALLFTTHLAGVMSDGTPVDLGMGYTWTSNYNGTFGGISVVGSDGSGTPGSGTGGLTVINVSNTTTYQYPRTSTSTPTLLEGGDVSTRASGLSYSRVSQSFVGAINVVNDSQSTLSGPFQLVLYSLTPSTNVVIPSGNFSGSPYLLIPGSDNGLASGKSATVNVQFSNPYDLQINFAPVVYAGEFN